MLEVKDIETMAKLKLTHLKNASEDANKIPEALAKFDGKSITGNKKRISDAIAQIDPSLRVEIESDGWGWVRFIVRCYAKERSFQTSAQRWEYIDGVDIILWETFKDNTLNLETVKTLIENYQKSTARQIERLKYTSAKIKQIAEKTKKLHDELTQLALATDRELTDAFGITFKHN